MPRTKQILRREAKFKAGAVKRIELNTKLCTGYADNQASAPCSSIHHSDQIEDFPVPGTSSSSHQSVFIKETSRRPGQY